MKNLRKHSAILVILSLLFSSCLTFSGIDFDSFQDNPDYRDKLIGLWVLDTSESGNYDTLEFKTDGTCSVVWYKNNKVTQTWATRYKVSNFQVVFSFEQRNDIRRANYVIIDNNTLSLTNWSNDSPNETYHKSGVVQSEIDRNDIESVLKKATDTVISNIPKETTIAIINISSGNSEVSEFIAGELENILVNNGFIVVDRSQLDKIRQEQDFQLSGDVDDSSAVSMGKFAGANIVMTGAITGSGNMRRFRLRALDTQTARVVGSASEALLDRTVSHQTATTTSSENVSYKIGDRGPAGGIVFYDSFTLKPGVLSVGVEIGYPPMEYLDSDGVTPVGFDISMARALAEKMGLEVEFIDTAWAGIFAGVDTDKYDCII
ncbi:MAG: transporter substrate-binding domain-containing protein, partial [Treponema sp.]|nr:transporter substrate-binding domain-containing protein [Treponema sp.]